MFQLSGDKLNAKKRAAAVLFIIIFLVAVFWPRHKKTVSIPTVVSPNAPVQETHGFVRPHFPQRRELTTCGCMIVVYRQEFTVPKTGEYTVDYKSFYPGKYDGKTVIATPPNFRDRKREGTSNKAPIYDVDQGLDHITVKAKPGTHWWYSFYVAIPKVPDKVTN
jgi:hypothetical protein